MVSKVLQLTLVLGIVAVTGIVGASERNITLSGPEIQLLKLGQNPELLEFAALTLESVIILIDDPTVLAVVQENVNANFWCLPWLQRFPGGSIRWLFQRRDVLTGDPIAGSILSEVSGTDPLVRIGGDFNEWLNLTSTVLIPGAVSTSNGLYICEVCLFRGTQFEECHLANTSLQVIGGPPILDFATDNNPFSIAGTTELTVDIEYKIGSDFCIDPNFRGTVTVLCQIVNAESDNFLNISQAFPIPFRSWSLNGDLLYSELRTGTPNIVDSTEFFSASVDRMVLMPQYFFPESVLRPTFVGRLQGGIQLNFALLNATFAPLFDSLEAARAAAYRAVVGAWTCRANNTFESDMATSNVRICAVRVCSPTEFSRIGDVVPVGCTVCIPEGRVVTLNCTRQSTLEVSVYEWRNGAGIVVSTSPLLISGANNSYTCNTTYLDHSSETVASVIAYRDAVTFTARTADEFFSAPLIYDGCSRLNNQVGLENIAVCAFVGETLELNCATDDNMVPLEITAPDGSMATGSLIVSSVDIGDEGTYSCRLSNDPGPCGLSTEQREVRVFSYYVPESINHTAITSSLISLRAVEITFIIPAENNIPIAEYRYILCRNDCANSTISTVSTVSRGNNMLSFTIRQLIPNSQYILRVYAVNEFTGGTTPVDDADAHIFNSATKADGRPVNLIVYLSTDTHLVLSWTLPALATQPDVIVMDFNISWGRTGDPSSSDLLPFSPSTPQQRFAIPSILEPSTRYTIEVIAYYSVPFLISDGAAIIGTTLPNDQVRTTTCPPGRDSIWDVEWPETGRNVTVQGICPHQLGTDVSGQATRYCNSEGVWADPDVLQCKNMEFISILEQVTSTSSEELVEQAANLTMQLAAITQPNAISLLPSSLNATNQVLSLVISALKEESTTTDANELIVDVLNNVLEINNSQGWNDLQSTDAGSQVLLDNAERLGVLLARSQNANGTIEPVRVSRPNIAISSSLINISKDITKDITFPQIEDLVNYTNSSTLVPAAIRISSALLADRLDEQKNTAIPTVFILFQNLGSFLPTPTDGLSNTTQGASVVISSQVGERGNGRPSQTLQQSPLSLNFTFNEVENPENYRCVFWNFSEPVGNGGWISDGVSTINNATEGSTTTVQCSSTHLTSFAVLVDLGGPKNSSLVERKILDVVSYAGCSISVVCLIVAVIFFLAQGKQLFNKVHYFVHLNFSISLLLAFLVFIVGIDTAVGNRVGCAFVTALLHYLFLAVFCWMLCEGVMLYLLLVAVFSAVTRKWWFFLMLGYLLPLPFVLVTVAVRWRYYGIAETEQSEFCWLTTRDGTIFGFVAPMLAVIVINIVFLVFILKSLWKNKKSAAKRMEKEESNFELVKSLLQGVVVLQPLLGLTWAFGLLTLVRNTSAFVWIFTILNSLQGVAVLFFHVIRNDQVKQKINYWCMKLFRPSTISRYDTTGMSNLTSESLKDTSTLKSTLPSGITLPLSEHSEQSQYSQLPITETKMELANEADDVMEAVADSLDTKVDLKHDSNATEDLSNLVDSKDDEKMDMIVDKTTTLTNKDV